ncbi:MAG: hypothetical protein AYK19_01585 [Theionarchaea archaeon DG-70-1]|nr:MAG: hypothetical protein AYK19_01585 [Theionarchaea archaeon DG-70-1]
MGGDNAIDVIKLVEKVKTEILLAFLILLLFVFDKDSAIDSTRMLIVFILSSNIMKNHFSHLIIKLSDHGNGRIYEYTSIAIFSFFIFIEIEFLLNGVYIYAFLAFILLLVNASVTLHLIVRRGQD